MTTETPGHIAVVGSSHKVAPVGVRDALFPRGPRTDAFFEAVRLGDLGASEGVALITCSRAELYVVSPDAASTARRVQEWLLDGRPELTDYTFVKTGRRAVRHLFSVAGGLDSIMLGEHEVLGQIRESLKTAQREGTAGALLERLFHSAQRAGRRARSETAIGQGGTSLAFAAADSARDMFPPELRGTALIVGAGRTGALAAHHFHKDGWRRILIANRTLSRATEVAESHGGTPISMDEIARAVEEADAVVGAVSSPRPVLTSEMLADGANRRSKPLLMLDLGNPRNVDPAVGSLPNVDLRDLDSLQRVSQENQEKRAEEIPAARRIVEEEAARFNAWIAHRSVVPLLKTLRESFQGIAEVELAKHARHFDDSNHAALERYTRALLNRLLHHPISHMKELAEETQDPNDQIAAFQEIFVAAGWGDDQGPIEGDR